jgi:hypothetical protein
MYAFPFFSVVSIASESDTMCAWAAKRAGWLSSICDVRIVYNHLVGGGHVQRIFWVLRDRAGNVATVGAQKLYILFGQRAGIGITFCFS